MSKVSVDISVSLDGFIAGPNDGIDNGLGDGGEQLHQWLYDLEGWRQPHGLEGGKTNQDSAMLEEGFKSIGAIIIGRRMFDIAEKPWGDTPPFHMPVFVVTHRPHDTLVKEGGTSFIFVTDGIESALKQAQTAAGDKDVGIGGGASIIQQYLKAGLLDELQMHLVPVLLGGGIRLFENTGDTQLEQISVMDSPSVTHLKYRVIK
jgi:dihydrofolate reductase